MVFFFFEKIHDNMNICDSADKDAIDNIIFIILSEN